MHTRLFVVALAIAAGSLAIGRPAFAQTIQFDPPVTTVATTKSVGGFAAADFNQDGRVDLARTDNVEGVVVIFLGNGQGGFTRGASFGTPSGPSEGPSAIAAADLNGDGHEDLVLSGQTHTFVAFGNGDGTFQPAQAYGQPASLTQIVVADLNGDGWPDVVGPFGSSAGPNGIAIDLNDSHGQLVAQPSIALGAAPVAVVVADFTGDHVADLAMASTAGFTAGASLIAFAGAGDGTFSPGTPYTTSAPATSIAADDFTGDGVVDLVLAQGTSAQGPNGLDLFVGVNDAASFRPAAFTASPAVGRLFAADLNGDGRLDLAASGGQAGLLAFAGDLEGNFETPIAFPTNGGGVRLLADFNGDGKLDAATMDAAVTSMVAVLNSTPAAVLGPAQPIAWIDPVNVTVNGGSLQKTGGCDGCFDASAASQQAIDGTVDSGVRFIAARDPLLAVGLSTSTNATPLDAIDFAIRPQGGFAEVRERGVYKKDIAFADGDEFRILIQGTTVRYVKNGAPFYVSAATPTYPLHAAALIASAGGAVSDAQIFGSAGTGGGGGDGGGGGATWGAAQNVTVDGTRVTKTSGCDGCFDASVVSADQIESDGFLEFTVDDTDSLLIAGLTTALTNGDSASVDFGIRLQGGDAEVREQGVYKTDVPFHAGDIFRISVSGGVVTYSLNGAVIYTSDQTPSGPLFAAVSIASVGASLNNVTFSSQ